MITKILSRKQFDELLRTEGWFNYPGKDYLVCPFDNSIYLSPHGTFSRGNIYQPDYEVITKITNIKDGNWVYDDATGLMYNGLIALKVK